MVIGQESIGEKTNEIPHFQALMGKIGDLHGVVITANALHTQRAHAEFLHSKAAHYVLTVKTDQRALRERIASQTWACLPAQHRSTESSP
jgi:predicted transposase YbfD/YdcC